MITSCTRVLCIHVFDRKQITGVPVMQLGVRKTGMHSEEVHLHMHSGEVKTRENFSEVLGTGDQRGQCGGGSGEGVSGDGRFYGNLLLGHFLDISRNPGFVKVIHYT